MRSVDRHAPGSLALVHVGTPLAGLPGRPMARPGPMIVTLGTIASRMRLNFFSQHPTPESEPPAATDAAPRTGRTFPADEVAWGIVIRNGFDELDDPSYHLGVTQHAYLVGNDNVAICGFQPPRTGSRTRRRPRLGLPTVGVHPMCGVCAKMVVAPRPRVAVPMGDERPRVAIPVTTGAPAPLLAGAPAPRPAGVGPRATAGRVSAVAAPAVPAPGRGMPPSTGPAAPGPQAASSTPPAPTSAPGAAPEQPAPSRGTRQGMGGDAGDPSRPSERGPEERNPRPDQAA